MANMKSKVEAESFRRFLSTPHKIVKAKHSSGAMMYYSLVQMKSVPLALNLN